MQIVHSRRKVREWLSVHGGDGRLQYQQSEQLELQQELHLAQDTESLLGELETKTSVSDRGTIAVSNRSQSSLLITQPGRQPFALPTTDWWSSIEFLPGQRELLAAYCYKLNGICLWDVERRTSRMVYRAGEPRPMHLCAIDGDTMAYVEAIPSTDGTVVSILKTSEPKWRLVNSIQLQTSERLKDVAFTRTPDGAAVLILVSSSHQSVRAVELVGGRTKWVSGPAQLGPHCRPLSACTDELGSFVFVVDVIPSTLHVLSSEDGSLRRTVSLVEGNDGAGPVVTYPVTVQRADHFLYVGLWKTTPEGNDFVVRKYVFHL